MINNEIKGTNYLADLFSKHFPAADVDAVQLDVLFLFAKSLYIPYVV
ncbi:MAG: hypothetical protein ABFD52_10905 [Acidobacteriota bacterium]